MRLIDADMVYDLFEPFADAIENIEQSGAFLQSLQAVQDAPTVDAVEVVRCRNCEHYHVETYFLYGDYELFKWCDFLNIRGKFPPDPKPMDFCSYGERKETDHE